MNTEILIVPLIVLAILIVSDRALKIFALRNYWKQLLLTYIIVGILCIAWDAFALWRGLWWWGEDYLLGIYLVGKAPIEDLAYLAVFMLLPIIAWEYFRKKNKAP